MSNEVVQFEEWGDTVSAEDMPLTPLEAWYLIRGYAVKPKIKITVENWEQLPGKVEIINGFLMFKQ